MSQAKVIVVGNEKGGAGKSTIAIHIATALLHGGAKVATLDLDVRQQSLAHFFAHRRAWLDANEHLIEKTLSFATQLKPDMPPHIWFHGTPCRLQNHILATIQYENGLFKLPKQDWPQQKQHLRHYLHQHAADTLLPRLHVHAAATGLLPAATALSNAKTFWGVCRRHTGIRLNWRLIGAPDFVTDYICIHELCHLTHPNHSPRFWALVEHHTPHTAAAKTWLKQYGNELFWLD